MKFISENKEKIKSLFKAGNGNVELELKVVGDNLGETAVVASHLNSAAEIRGHIIYHTQ